MLVREGGAWIGDLGVAAPRRRSSRANDMLLGSAERPLMLGPDHPDFPIPNMFMFRPVQRTVLSVAEFEEAVAAADPFDTICIAADLSFTQADIDRGISSLQKPLRLIGADVEAHAEGHRFDNVNDGGRRGGVHFPIRRHILRVPSGQRYDIVWRRFLPIPLRAPGPRVADGAPGEKRESRVCTCQGT